MTDNLNVENNVNCDCMRNRNKFNKITPENIIPTSWKKFGELYCNKDEQPVFVCLICLEKADSINTTYTTSDGSAFWWHIQHQHIVEECETIDKISEEIQKFETNDIDTEVSNAKNDLKIAEPTDFNYDKSKEERLNSLEVFHENMVKNNLIKESVVIEQTNYVKEHDEQFAKNELKPDIIVEDIESCASLFANSSNDNETYTISDYEADEDEEEHGNSELLGVISETRVENYLRHNDMIELSDDDDQDEVVTQLNSSMLKNDKITMNDSVKNDVQNLEERSIIQSNHTEENILSCQSACTLNGIITPDISPCESLTNQQIDTNLNYSQNNDPCVQYSEDTHWDMGQHLPKKSFKSIRPYKCEVCGIRTTNVLSMQIHQVRFHGISLQELTDKHYYQFQRPNQIQHQNFYFSKQQFKCNICNRITKTEKNLIRHYQIYHSPNSHLLSTKCAICNKRILTSRLEQHRLSHDSAGHKCDFCGIVYRQKYYLNNDIVKYHTDRNLHLASVNNQQHLATNLNTSRYFYNNQQQSLMSPAITTVPTSLLDIEEQQLRYRGYYQNTGPLQDPLPNILF